MHLHGPNLENVRSLHKNLFKGKCNANDLALQSYQHLIYKHIIQAATAFLLRRLLLTIFRTYHDVYKCYKTFCIEFVPLCNIKFKAHFVTIGLVFCYFFLKKKPLRLSNTSMINLRLNIIHILSGASTWKLYY